jgi:hypothetical protein
MTNRKLSVFVVVSGFLFLATSVFAHHSFEAEFKSTDPVELRGIVSKVEWINPHIYLYVDVKDTGGK